MTDIVIKPSNSGGSVKLQTEGGTNGLTMASTGDLTTSGNVAVTGIVTGGTLGSGVTFPSGHMIDVAQVLYKSATSDNSSNQWNDYPGDIGNGSLSITPKATNSKFLVTWHLAVLRLQGQYSCMLRLNRKIASGSWDDTICIGESSSNRTRCTFAVRSPNENNMYTPTWSGTFLDTPTLTDLSPLYYKFTFNNAPTVSYTYPTYFGRNSPDWDDSGSGNRIVQSLTVQEIAG